MTSTSGNTVARIGGVLGAAVGRGVGGWLAVLYGNTMFAGVGGGIGALVGWYVGRRLRETRSSSLGRRELDNVLEPNMKC